MYTELLHIRVCISPALIALQHNIRHSCNCCCTAMFASQQHCSTVLRHLQSCCTGMFASHKHCSTFSRHLHNCYIAMCASHKQLQHRNTSASIYMVAALPFQTPAMHHISKHSHDYCCTEVAASHQHCSASSGICRIAGPKCLHLTSLAAHQQAFTELLHCHSKHQHLQHCSAPLSKHLHNSCCTAAHQQVLTYMLLH